MGCGICEAIAAIEAGRNPYFVTALEASYVVLGRHQFFRGYSLLLSRRHAHELYQLPAGERAAFMDELSLVAQAISRWVKPRKINYAMLGNIEPHLHWHIFPRHADDQQPKDSIWSIPQSVREAPQYEPDAAQLEGMKRELRNLIAESRGKGTGSGPAE